MARVAGLLYEQVANILHADRHGHDLGLFSMRVEWSLANGAPEPPQSVPAIDLEDFDDLVARSRDLERLVLARAVRGHLDRRILCYGNETVVFD